MDIAVRCDVQPGLRTTERTVAVTDTRGRREFLRIEAAYLRHEGGHTYLPVGLIYEHPPSNSVLVELPLEADSGTRRLFVPKGDIIYLDQVPA